MKKINKKIIITLLLSVLLTSCGNNEELDNTNINDNSNIDKTINTSSDVENNSEQTLEIEFDSNGINVLPKGGKIGSDNKIIESPKIETEFIDDTLSIGGNVTIKEGKAQDFPADFPIITGGQIYNNSNMKEYGFIIVDKEITEIEKFYIKELEKSGWISNKENQEENANNKDFKFFLFNKKLENNIYKQVEIKINSTIPTVIKESFEVDGIFIEINFKEIFISEENLENN